MSQQLIKPTKLKTELIFRPDETLLELAYMIRSLKSIQTRDVFFDEKKPSHRCVTGALAVEFFGSNNNSYNIDTVLNNKTKYTKFRYNSVAYNSRLSNSGTYTINNNIWWKMAHMNNSGRSFSEIADWTELEAYKHGEWK